MPERSDLEDTDLTPYHRRTLDVSIEELVKRPGLKYLKKKLMTKLELLPIEWVLEPVDCTNHSYWAAFVRGVQMLSIIDNVLDSGTKFYIHTSFQSFEIYGNRGIQEWGWFDNIETAKDKAEELIMTELYSFFK